MHYPMHSIVIPNPLTEGQGRAIEKLAEAATSHDGVAPFDEQTLLDLKRGTARKYFLVYEHSYAGAECDDVPEPNAGAAQEPDAAPLWGVAILHEESGTAEIAVDPHCRNCGIASQLIATLSAERAGKTLFLWAHGSRPASLHLAEKFSMIPSRELLVMNAELESTESDGETACVPSNVVLRRIDSTNDADVDNLVRLNARSFNTHPEQGKLLREDFLQRFEQPWFDADLLQWIVDEKSGKTVGFLWLKPESSDCVELYVLGVDPKYQGKGLAGAAMRCAMASMRARGFTRMTLYVNRSNSAAVRLYERAGFQLSELHTCFQL
ncbi:mycothiol synthase [Arcanobacterium bovis]|nr:mycothiol synthase [Arcanobacterium bovis]